MLDNCSGGAISVVFRLRLAYPWLLDQSRFTMNPKLLLKAFSVVLLSFVPVVGMGGVVRSQPAPKALPAFKTPQEEQRYWQAKVKEIPVLIQSLKTGAETERRSAISGLVYLGQAALPSLIPLFKDPNPETQAIVAEIVDQIELSTTIAEALDPLPSPVFTTLPQIYYEKPTFSVDEAIRIIQRAARTTAQASKAARLTGVVPAFLVPASISREEYKAEQTLVLSGNSAVPKLMPLLQTDDITVRSRFARILTQIRPQSPEAIATIGQLLQSPDANVRKQAAKILGEIGKAAKPQLAMLLKNSNPKVRAAAADAIAHLPGTPKSLIPELIPLLQDSNPSVRIYAVLALKKMGEFGKPAIPTLTALLKDESKPVRLISSKVLQALQPKRPSGEFSEGFSPSLYPSIAASPSSYPSIDDNQQQPPVKISVPDAVQALLDAEEYGDEYQAIQQLRAIGQPAVPALIPLFKNDYQTTRQLAARAIGDIGSAALPDLLPLLDSSDQADRKLALSTLSNMQDAALLPQFVALLNDPNEAIRSTGRIAINNLPLYSPDLVPSLIPLLKHSNSELRSNAFYALTEISDWKAKTLPHILPFLKDSNPAIRYQALSAIRKMGSRAKSAVAAIQPLMQQDTPEIQALAKKTLIDLGAIPDPTAPVASSTPMLLGLSDLGELPPPPGESTLPDDYPFSAPISFTVAPPLANPLRRTPSLSIDQAIKALRDSEDSGFGDPTYQAKQQLGQLGKTAIPKVLPLLQDENPVIRSRAADVLCCFIGEFAIPSVLPLLQHPKVEVRSSAIAALSSKTPDAEIIKTARLIPLLDDRELSIRIQVIQNLGTTSNSTFLSIPVLKPLIQSPDFRIRAVAAGAFGDIYSRNPQVLLAKALPIAQLTPLLKDPQPLVRWRTVKALEQTRNPETIPALIPLLQDDSSVIQDEVINNIRQIGPTTLPFLTPLLQSSTSNRRNQILSAMSWMKIKAPDGDTILPILFALLQDPSPETRANAIRVLSGAKSYGSRVVPQLIPLLKDQDSSVVNAAIYAIGNMGTEGKTAVPELINLLKTSSDYEPIGTALGQIGPAAAAAIPELKKRLNGQPYGSDRMIQWVIDSIQQANKPPTNPPFNGRPAPKFYNADIASLIWLLQDHDAEVRRDALRGLSRSSQSTIQSGVIMPRLVALLRDSQPEVRAIAAEAIGAIRISDPSITPLLKSLLNDPSPAVRSTAAEALKKLGYKP
jgi:HEAT repeat protein